MSRSFNDVLTGNFSGPAEEPPVEMLNKLVSSLGRKMSYKIDFQVSSAAAVGGRISHTVRASIRSIDYELDLLTVSHQILQLYPVKLTGMLGGGEGFGMVEIHNEQELFEKLAESFNSKKAQDVLGTLVKQA